MSGRRFDRREVFRLAGGGWAAAAAAGGLAAILPAGAEAYRPGERVEGGPIEGIEASWWKRLDGNRVECGLCPRKCRVADRERGACGGRENRGGTYRSLVWGLVCALHADPVEKKPFFHVRPGSTALSYATAGCNVECKFCQNWEISQFRPEQVDSVWVPPEAMVQAARRAGAPLVAATYSEPVIFWEYVRDVSRAARKAGIGSLVVSNGYIQEKPLGDVLPLLEAYKVDLKSFRERFYRDVVRGELRPVLETMERIRAAGVWLEIVVLIVPTLNDSDAEARDLARWVKANLGAEVPVHFTRFHPTYRLTNLPPTPVATLDRLWKLARAEGLEYVYVGNVPGHPGENTVCPGCGTVLIRRLGFRILENRLKRGRCPKCGRRIPGVW